jgi:MoaA/NifB/PqqE/SkfB family radical SAM enzyme
MKTLLKKYLPPSIQSLIFSVINTAKNFKKTVTGETKSPYGDEYKNLICPNPFSYMEFMVGGGVHTCCYLSQAFGNLKNENFMDAWNSEEAVKIRKSILDGDFRYCNKQKCAAMQQYKYDSSKKAYPYRLIKKDSLTDPYLKNIVANNITRLSNGPKIISFDNDPSCNLYCPSCRKQRLSLSGKQFQEAKALTEKLLKSIKNDVEELWFAGSGDPFAK